MSRIRIGISLLPLIPGQIGGAETYMRNLVAHLARIDQENEYVLFVTPQTVDLVPPHTNFAGVIVNIPASVRSLRVLWEQAFLPLYASRYRLDLLHCLANTLPLLGACPTVVTVHDIMFRFYPQDYPQLRRLFLTMLMPMSVRKAWRILPNSQFTGKCLVDHMGADPSRVVVVHHGIEEDFRPPSPDQVERFRQAMGLPQRFLLYTANTYASKNHCRLLEAFHLLRTTGLGECKLVLRGSAYDAEAKVNATIRRLDLSAMVIRLPYLSREYLPLLYSSATALIFPSLFEGWGMPVLEAMACGCPVVASRVTAIPEIVGDAGILIDPHSVEDIAWGIRRIIEDIALREQLSQKGIERAQLFTCKEMARRTLAVYKTL